MKYFVQKKVSKFVLVGLVFNLLPVSVFAQEGASVRGKLSREKIDWYLKQIHNTSTIFETIANKLKVGADKVKNAFDESIAVLSGKKKKMSKESKKIIGATVVAGGGTAVVGGIGVAGATGVLGSLSVKAAIDAAKKVLEDKGKEAYSEAIKFLNANNKTIIEDNLKSIQEGFLKNLKAEVIRMKGSTFWSGISESIRGDRFISLGDGVGIKEKYLKILRAAASDKKISYKKLLDTLKKQTLGTFRYVDDADIESQARGIKRLTLNEFNPLNTMKTYILPALLISGGVHIFLLPAYLISLGLTVVTVSGILAAVYGGAIGISALHVKRLEKEEQRFPGVLTASDRAVIKKFKNVVKGPIVRALIKGKQIKAARRNIVKEIFEENKDFFIGKFGTKKRSLKDIEKYLLAKLRIPGLGKILYPMNLNIRWYNYLKYMDIKDTWKVINEYKKMKEGLNQDERNELMREQIAYMKKLYDNMSKTKRLLKRLTPGFNLLNAKEIALKIVPSYAMNQNALNSDLKTVRNLEAKYGSALENKIEQPLEDYKKKQSEIIISLSVE